ALAPEVPLTVVTVTSTVPAAAAGDVAVIDVGEFTVTLVARPAPNATLLAPTTNPEPVIVTEVPPPSGPPLVLSPVTSGAGSNVNRSALLGAEVPPGVVTVTSTLLLA